MSHLGDAFNAYVYLIETWNTSLQYFFFFHLSRSFGFFCMSICTRERWWMMTHRPDLLYVCCQLPSFHSRPNPTRSIQSHHVIFPAPLSTTTQDGCGRTDLQPICKIASPWSFPFGETSCWRQHDVNPLFWLPASSFFPQNGKSLNKTNK